eukprot:scaffold6711_cov118-Isochrysis_galbana.AAC.34
MSAADERFSPLPQATSAPSRTKRARAKSEVSPVGRRPRPPSPLPVARTAPAASLERLSPAPATSLPPVASRQKRVSCSSASKLPATDAASRADA